MEQFIQDTGLSKDDLNMDYDKVMEMYKSGRLAMYFGSSSGVKIFQDQGIDTTKWRKMADDDTIFSGGIEP